MSPIRYISLFSGGFGLDLGLEAAGFETAVCVEIAAAMRETIRHNRPLIKIIGDGENDCGGNLYELSTSYILQSAGLHQGEVDLVVGGPPCQSFSILGKRQGLNDPRGSLMLEFARVVRDVQPRGFILENVIGFKNLHKGSALAQVKEQFHRAGYPKIHEWILNAVDFGVPQYRERIFLIGFREDLPQFETFTGPIPTHRSPTLTLFDLSQPENYRPEYRLVEHAFTNMTSDLPNHEFRAHGEAVRDRYRRLPPGQRDSVDHTDRLQWNRPSGTVLVGSSKGGGRPFIHPEEPRHITVREAARLQTFPDNWIFYGSQTDQYRQVGNAVPCRLSHAVAQRVLSYFDLLNVGGSDELSANDALSEYVHVMIN